MAPSTGPGIEPGREGERVHVVETGDGTAVDETPVEAARLALPSRHEFQSRLRTAVHERRFGRGGFGLRRPLFRLFLLFLLLLGLLLPDPLQVPRGLGPIAVQREMHQQASIQGPVPDPPRLREFGFPGALRLSSFAVQLLKMESGFSDLGVQFLEAGRLRRRRRLDHRVLVAVVVDEAPLGDVVEEGEEPVVLLLADGIVLVVVTAGAPHRQPHPDRGGGLHPVGHVLDPELLVDGAPLGAGPVVPVESGGDDLIPRRSLQQIPRQLLDGESMETEVPVEGVDDPVPPAPHVADAITLVAVGVGVAGRFQPADRHVLPVAGGAEQAVHQLLVGVGRRIA